MLLRFSYRNDFVAALPMRRRRTTTMMMLMMRLLVVVMATEAFKIVEKLSEPSHPRVGGKVLLKCRSNDWFEYCTWRHKDRVCEFEWKRSHRAVKKQTCSALGQRARFVGTYDSHECYIEIDQLTRADAGEWSCEMEEYVSGPLRGWTAKAVIQLDVLGKAATMTTVAPRREKQKTTDSTTTVSTTSSSTSFTTESVTTSMELDPPASTSSTLGDATDTLEADNSTFPFPEQLSNSTMLELNEKFKTTFIPLFLAIAAAVIVIILGTVVAVYRHRQKYQVTTPLKEEGRETETEDEEENRQVRFFKKTGRLVVSPFGNSQEVDMEENQTPANGASVLNCPNTLY